MIEPVMIDLGRVWLARLPRGRCAHCGLRRVLFRLVSDFGPRSLSFCATCAGLRG